MFTFIETKLFTRLVDDYLSDEEFAAVAVYERRAGAWPAAVSGAESE